MQILRKIKPTKSAKASHSYYRAKGTQHTIKEMLLKEGYTDKEIKELKQQERIFITPSSFGAKLKPSQELVIIGEYKKLTPLDPLEDRFEDLEEE